MSTSNGNISSNPFNIVCEEKKGRAAILDGAPPPFIAEIIFDKPPEPVESQVWTVQRVEGTPNVAFQNVEHGLWAYARDGQVVGSLEYDEDYCSWHAKRGVDGKYKINIPGQDLIWTVKARVPGAPEILSLERDDGSEAQEFTFAPL